MSVLTPHAILQKLGFSVPEEGLHINPNDAYLYDVSLDLIGKATSTNLDNLPDDDFKTRFVGLAVFASTDQEAENFVERLENDASRSRGMVAAILGLIKK